MYKLTELTCHSVTDLIFGYSPFVPLQLTILSDGGRYSSEFPGRYFWYLSDSLYPLKLILMTFISFAYIIFTFLPSWPCNFYCSTTG
jgi:hypothetical protein